MTRLYVCHLLVAAYLGAATVLPALWVAAGCLLALSCGGARVSMSRGRTCAGARLLSACPAPDRNRLREAPLRSHLRGGTVRAGHGFRPARRCRAGAGRPATRSR